MTFPLKAIYPRPWMCGQLSLEQGLQTLREASRRYPWMSAVIEASSGAGVPFGHGTCWEMFEMEAFGREIHGTSSSSVGDFRAMLLDFGIPPEAERHDSLCLAEHSRIKESHLGRGFKPLVLLEKAWKSQIALMIFGRSASNGLLNREQMKFLFDSFGSSVMNRSLVIRGYQVACVNHLEIRFSCQPVSTNKIEQFIGLNKNQLPGVPKTG